MLMKISFESKGDFNNATSWLKKVVNGNPATILNQVAKQGEQSLAANTSKDTGETASGWKSKIKTKGDVTEIEWYNDAHPELEVNLAKLIELGHGTRTGGYVPPKPYIKKSMDPVFKSVGDKVAKELFR